MPDEWLAVRNLFLRFLSEIVFPHHYDRHNVPQVNEKSFFTKIYERLLLTQIPT